MPRDAVRWRRVPPRARRETHTAARRFQHSLILNGSVKDDAWFKTSVKSEFSSHMAYLKR